MDTQIETEELDACPVCGAKEKKFLFKNTDRMHGIPGEFGLNQCLNCSVFYLSPRPTLKALPQYYPDEYPPHQFSEVNTSDASLRSSRDLLRNTILYEVYHLMSYANKPRIKPHFIAKPVAYMLFPLWKRARYGLSKVNFPKYVNGGKALDIGCGTGNYLRILREFGWDVYGIEPSERASEIGRKQFGLNIKTGTLLDYKFPDNYFHFISMNHVLEHLHNPVEVLSEAKRILHPDGIIAIRTPNMNSFGYRRFGKNWLPIDTPRHLIIYSKQSITKLASQTELITKILSTATSNLYGSLEYEIRDKNNNYKDFGITGKYTFSQKLYINALDLYERMLILLGKDAGEELQAILVKR
ncbi:MAG: class I SAM-dependent methyltransferase [bacterium]